MPRRCIDRKAPDTFRSRTSSTIDVGVAKGFLADSNSTVDYSMTGSNLSRPAASGVYSDSILGRLAALGRSGLIGRDWGGDGGDWLGADPVQRAPP